MDHCFIITKSEKFNLKLSEKLNNVHEVISFTKETGVNNQLQFLHVLIKKRRDKTIVYRKLTFTGQYLNFQSSHTIVKEDKLS